MMNKEGYFSDDGKAFIINTPQTPRHWYNYLWNEHYVSLMSQVGQGESFSQDKMGNRIPLVATRMLFLQDAETGKFWSLNGLSRQQTTLDYYCKHSLGSTTISLRHDDISTMWRVFVPTDERVEIWTLTLTNHGEKPRQVHIFPVVDTLIDGATKPQAYYMSRGYWDTNSQAVVVSADCDFDGVNRAYNFMMSDCPTLGYDSNERAFIGYGTWQHPDALDKQGCTNSDCEMEKPILGLQTTLSLDPNEVVVMNIIVGTALDTEEIKKSRDTFFTNKQVETAYQHCQKQILSEIGAVRFELPNQDFTYFANYWLKRQITLGTQWARVRHNGYRDLVQDIGAMAFFNPSVALQRLERVLSMQYSNGYAPRTWLHGEILDKDFSDNHVWIPQTVYNLVVETGDVTLLERLVPFNDGTVATIYEHVRRALDYLWQDRGMFGLCRIRSGDWNDALNQVGNGGEGVSIWLSMAWLWANDYFIELADYKNETEHLEIASQRATEMRTAIQEHGWDGHYFIRAYTDEGRPIGSSKNKQGTLFLNPQTWAVLCGLDRGAEALDFAEQGLETELGILSVENAYSEYDPNIGLMSRKTPGIQENGGVYLHASTFKLVADCMLGRRDSVAKGIKTLMPFGREAEPYVFSNCYFTIKDSYRYGTTGQSWGTGTAGWFFLALLNHVFGLQAKLDGLHINPCLPSAWTKCRVIRPFRGATYDIQFEQQGDKGQIAQIIVDGNTWSDTVLPYEVGKFYKVYVELI